MFESGAPTLTHHGEWTRACTMTSCDLSIMTRRCLLTFRPFRIFVVGIGFFSLCFLMTSLGGQFSAKRPADSPFATRAEVFGGQESRSVLRKISDMLEVIMKRMDALSRLGNTTETHKLDELASVLDRIQPIGLMERIQAIAQNMSDMAGRVEQMLQRSIASKRVRDGTFGQCDIPKDPRYPDCPGKMDWMRARWTSDPCYAFYGVDGSDCSFLIYLSEVEWFCPPLAWRNQTATPTLKPPPRKQAVFRFDTGALLEQVGTRKESLNFMKRRIRRLAAQWASAARRLADKLRSHWRDEKRILVHVGFLTEESGDVFSPKVLKGGPLGEMVQWADILTALYVLGHDLKISVSVKELHGFLGVPPGRGSCPLTGPLPFDLIYTDYHGLQQMKQHMGLSLKKHKCRVRVIDTFGTEPAYNHEEYATLHGYRTNWGYWNLNSQQYMTMFPHTPDNSFMGFVAEELNDTARMNIQRNKVNNMAVVYGKEVNMWKLHGKETFLSILHRYMEIHGTVYYETQRPPEVPAFVKNHGLLPQQELQQLLRKAKLFIGFGFPYEGPAPLEAIANGCIFLQPKFSPPHSSLNHDFFRGKPTSREVSSQHPYAEQYIGRPHVITIDFNNSHEFDAAIRDIMKIDVEPFLPYEYTCEGMLERIHAYIQNQDFCSPEAPFPPVNSSRIWQGSPLAPFMLLPNSSILTWASNATSHSSWPPLSALQLLASLQGQSCVKACQDVGLICEPALYRFINIKEAFNALDFQCAGLDSEMNHFFPAFSAEHAECGLQQDPLLFSCAGASAKYQRLCPCRDYRDGQVALCRDCL
ncbi:alpha-1,6-mannosylglycoprotein 6-beta-N-acetylglucosaminyltransferase B-like [Dunckerocampus dactyliophorus]|uniref:alpha-1,6-mannosylglycoprotein 6-beta-N-acetylglucosaminyltransferase B-like n=1 Tax=Dunckerocampus dactyliophorus TaxID=161453 RepID=UPI00240594FC|nr:alpha-1,6-mannosylglycoprotein 6-beta-N-acetylglucosaminyltransferase B-like [Dunckerocampus dactyliophorus]XP_054614740.1 alpha-1,6-mannosylglycoprotein 6-beta-N-acetylglucosaminyltransferase B-like [Dunckerocampus dactyliophorus]